MSDKTFKALLDVELKNRADLIKVLSTYLDLEIQENLDRLLRDREEHGSIEIAEEIILPHFESKMTESQVIIIRPNHKIKWSEKIKEVKLIIVIFLKKNETDTIKRQISQYTRKLADENYLEYLMKTETVDFNN
ncbi:PTS sugar transporter subunit IIA [Marinilactibacillus psychrotolerans]|uniref:PTS sugar transporter subunit IIA n=1 Tax=Marinilactibacillus psychrotolerans TaxID=191770 RepID=UPI00388B4A02